LKFRVGDNRKKKVISFSSILPDVIEDLDLEESFIIENLREKWPIYTGSVISAHSQPGRIFKKVLFVTVDHSIYANELSLLKGNILKKICNDFGNDFIKNIKFEIKMIKWKVNK
jgi:hypothetical protein